MKTLALTKTGTTVLSTYTWDNATSFPAPVNATTVVTQNLSGIDQATLGTTYIRGFAPMLSVLFTNYSIDDTGFEYNEYNWDFGDYYNTTNNNVSLSCARNVSHIYVMPGIYTVNLKHVQAKNASSLYGTINPNLSCFGKYNSFWNWYDLSTQGNNPIIWEDTKTNGKYQKKWVQFEANDVIATSKRRTLSSLDIIAVQKQFGPQITVEVLEILPRANMYSITPTTTGVTPLSVQLTPRRIQPGSFPIDRIDWNFGDGTPTRVVTRYNIPDSAFFRFTNTITNDRNDPRNYDAIYTYTRNFISPPVFYPSLTAYSSSTGTFDTCSLTIGPISLSSITTDTHLLKVKNTPYGKLYGLQVKNYVSFVVASSSETTSTTATYNVPQNPIKNSLHLTSISNTGYTGTGYPVLSAPINCP